MPTSVISNKLCRFDFSNAVYRVLVNRHTGKTKILFNWVLYICLLCVCKFRAGQNLFPVPKISGWTVYNSSHGACVNCRWFFVSLRKRVQSQSVQGTWCTCFKRQIPIVIKRAILFQMPLNVLMMWYFNYCSMCSSHFTLTAVKGAKIMTWNFTWTAFQKTEN